MKRGDKEYFLLINYKTKERFLCSWFEDEPDFFGQKIYYIGLTNGLGGYRQMLDKGFVDRRDLQPSMFLNTSTKLWLKRYAKA